MNADVSTAWEHEYETLILPIKENPFGLNSYGVRFNIKACMKE